jgi:TRAP-type C4-dicarboxylate transport system permease small subunit
MKRLLSTVETVAAVLLLAVAVLTAANVALRGFTNSQIPDWFDGSKLLMGMALFWGIAVATYQGSHICVDLLWEHLGAKNQRRLDIVAGLITFALIAPMAWMVFSKVLTSGTQKTADLGLPLMGFNLMAAAGGVAAAALAVARVVALWRRAAPDTGAHLEP